MVVHVQVHRARGERRLRLAANAALYQMRNTTQRVRGGCRGWAFFNRTEDSVLRGSWIVRGLARCCAGRASRRSCHLWRVTAVICVVGELICDTF